MWTDTQETEKHVRKDQFFVEERCPQAGRENYYDACPVNRVFRCMRYHDCTVRKLRARLRIKGDIQIADGDILRPLHQ